MAHVSAVVTTGIYCCPAGCSGRPKEQNRRRFATAAEAEANGFRACHVCRPYRRQPGVWLDGPELVCRALRLVLDGALDGPDTEEQLGARVGASARHLRRLFAEHVGVTPTQLARSTRAHFARRLIDDTELSFGDIAAAAAFGSVRQFNKVMRDTFKASPTELRSRRRRSDRLVADGGLAVRLPFGPPLARAEMLAHLAEGAIDGVESVRDGWYRRTITVAGHAGVVEIGPGGESHLEARFHLPHWEGLLHLAQRARRLFALDVDSATADRASMSDPRLHELVARRPGLRVPGAWDPFELAIAWLVRQDIPPSGGGAIRRLVESHGTPVAGLDDWDLTHLFPTPAALASAGPAGPGISAAAWEGIRWLAGAVADGSIELDGSSDQRRLAVRLAPVGRPAGPLAAELAFRLGEQRIHRTARDGANGRPERAIAVMHELTDLRRARVPA